MNRWVPDPGYVRMNHRMLAHHSLCSLAVRKTDVTLVKISWIISRRNFESDDVRRLTVDTVFAVGCE